MKEYARRTQPVVMNDDWVTLARSLMPRSQRHAVGSGFVDMLREIEAAKYRGHERHYTSPWAATLAGGQSREVWMLEKPFRKIPKGTVVTLASKAAWMEEAGAKLARVRYPKDRAFYKALRARVPGMRDLHLPEQYGALSRRETFTSVRGHSRANVVMVVRLSEGSVDLPIREVKMIFEKVFLVNRRESSKLGELCTCQGRLYRGNPLARQFVEIRTCACVKRLSALCASVGAKMTDYGAEILITHEFWDYFSAGFKKTVTRIVHESGLELAPDGLECSRVSPRGIEPKAVTGVTVDFDVLGWPYVRPLKRARQMRHIC